MFKIPVVFCGSVFFLCLWKQFFERLPKRNFGSRLFESMRSFQRTQKHLNPHNKIFLFFFPRRQSMMWCPAGFKDHLFFLIQGPSFRMLLYEALRTNGMSAVVRLRSDWFALICCYQDPMDKKRASVYRSSSYRKCALLCSMACTFSRVAYMRFTRPPGLPIPFTLLRCFSSWLFPSYS